jgi:hypothetical protein
MTRNHVKPTTFQRNLAKLPPALAPLIERPQWCVWRWTQKPDGKWQKPPFQAKQPDKHASTTDPTTWTDYPTALAAVQAGAADGISYILTKDDPFGAIDLDHCRDQLGSIAAWAQNYMQAAHATYQEITPSGEGIRIWGVADGDPLNRKFTHRQGHRRGETLKVFWPGAKETMSGRDERGCEPLALFAVLFPDKLVDAVMAEVERMASDPVPLAERPRAHCGAGARDRGAEPHRGGARRGRNRARRARPLIPVGAAAGSARRQDRRRVSRVA